MAKKLTEIQELQAEFNLLRSAIQAAQTASVARDAEMQQQLLRVAAELAELRDRNDTDRLRVARGTVTP